MKALHSFVVVTAIAAAGCTDPIAGHWHSFGDKNLVGDFELLLDADLVGHIDFATRDETGAIERIDDDVTALLVERADGIWKYEISVDGPDIDCEIDRRIEELSCEWKDESFDMEPYEHETSCDGVCFVGEPREPSCNDCTAMVCEFDKFCCGKAWDNVCRDQADVLCRVGCGG